ncbi:MAG TPA: hypothetical protein VHK06_02305 [Candidatus Limnocylindria bacterium]|nr:hypothetical protein [Candidatus Limnocylindria bacterium]
MTAGAPLSHDTAVEWLLASDEPAIRFQARRDLLGESAADDEARILEGPAVRALLDGQRADGGFGVHAYGKWGGAHWRLVSLVELAIPAGEPRAMAAYETVLGWLLAPSHRRNVPVINGLARRCASQEGNALAVGCRLGLAADARVELLARSLIGWQWPDGGWNCDRRPEAHRSSFHESLTAMWGLHEFAKATGDDEAAGSARRTAELILSHRVFRSLRTGEPLAPSTMVLHYPPYWRYDLLHGLVVLSRMALATDPRADDAVAHLHARRGTDGRWRAGARWWSPPGSDRPGREVLDWREGARDDRMVTLHALRVLAARGELEPRRAGSRRGHGRSTSTR